MDAAPVAGSAAIVVAPEVAEALERGGAVVALESTIISHGLPRPRNLEVAREVESVVRAAGAVPATIAVVDGEARIGLDEAALVVLATSDDVAKVSLRDAAVVAARGGLGATTVAATAHLAARAGIEVFATGGLGGVHRGARESWDESADLMALAGTPLTVVAAGVKSILDVGATLERLESLGIGVLGYGTDRFAGFYLADSGFGVPWRVDSPEEVASVMAARQALAVPGAVLVANPLPAARQMDPQLHERLLRDGLAAAAAEAIRGKAVTPFLLARFHGGSAGESLRVNAEIIVANASLAARIAVAAAARSRDEVRSR